MSKPWPVPHLDPNASLEHNARRILRVRTGEFYSYEPIVDDPRAVRQLHDLRIAAKRLRYTLELFRTVFGQLGESTIDQVKSVQEALGELHDFDVRVELVLAELKGLAVEQVEELGKALSAAPIASHASIATAALRPPPDDPRRGLIALLGREHVKRQASFEQFNQRWHELQSEGLRQSLVNLSNGDLIQMEAESSGKSA